MQVEVGTFNYAGNTEELTFDATVDGISIRCSIPMERLIDLGALVLRSQYPEKTDGQLFELCCAKHTQRIKDSVIRSIHLLGNDPWPSTLVILDV